MVAISGVIITLNEESDIARALRSIDWCDEIIVVDSGSTDRTMEICKRHGCTVIERPFSGYGQQKRFAVSQAKHDWIISLDADEVVSPALKDEILAALSDEVPEYRGYYLPISLVFWDGVIRHAGRFTKPKVRLFDRRYGNFDHAKVHETVKVDGRCKLLSNQMYNYSYANIADYLGKFNSYTSAAAQEQFARGKSASPVLAVLGFPAGFLKLYVLRGFLLDGWQGFLWSLFSAFYPVMKAFKLRECYRMTAPPPPETRPANIYEAAVAVPKTIEKM